MIKLNLSIVYNKSEDKILMCHREKDPYRGLYNLVGGKVETNEEELVSAYRELEEESGITKDDIILTRLVDFRYYISDIELQVYVGRLNKDVEVIPELNKLYWLDADSDFLDQTKFAGEGNIAHMIEQVKLYKEELLK